MMKSFIFIALLALGHSASANVCYNTVDQSMVQEFDEAKWKYHGIDELSEVEMNEILANPHDWTNEISEEELLELEQKYFLKGGYEFYLLTGTGDYSGGFQEILVVTPNDCDIETRYVIYAE
jgi:hypothetical protein